VDTAGRPLRHALEEWTPSPAEYVGLVPFVDGSRERLCRRTSVALVAQPGVRRVFVCRAFAEVALRQPAVAEAMVIHEILHTLGLGEAPMPGQPTSLEITQRVEQRGADSPGSGQVLNLARPGRGPRFKIQDLTPITIRAKLRR
jgi:hypothetical protein